MNWTLPPEGLNLLLSAVQEIQLALRTLLHALGWSTDLHGQPAWPFKQRVAGGDAMGTARLVQRVSSALMSKSYRSDAGEFEAEDEGAPERAMPAAKTEGAARPYFEVLFVTPTPPSHWPAPNKIATSTSPVPGRTGWSVARTRRSTSAPRASPRSIRPARTRACDSRSARSRTRRSR